MEKNTDTSTTREIDLLAAVKTVLKERKLLIKFGIVGAILGVVVALASPKYFTSYTVLAPEIASGGLGLSSNLADMASSFGIDIGGSNSNMDAIYPEIYPEVLASTDFIRKLFTVPVRLKKDDTERTYYEYLTQDVKIPFWKYPQIWLGELLKPKDPSDMVGGEADPFRIVRKEFDMCQSIAKGIDCSVDKKTSVITISVTEQDPLVAAILADTLQRRLQTYITAYRTQKARTDYDYYTKLHEEATADYKKAQSEYVDFCDVNKGIQLEKFIAKRNELENNMETAFTLMNQMAIQKQSAKAKIQERTPAYTILNSAKMPYKASSMPRSMMVLMFIFLACMADAAWVLFIRDIIRKKKD